MLRRPTRLRRVSVLAAIVAAMVATVAPTTASAGAHERGRYLDLRVATYNIHHAAGRDDVLDIAHTAKVLRSMRADVIGLQEVDRHWSERSELRRPGGRARRPARHARGLRRQPRPRPARARARNVASTAPRSCPATRSSPGPTRTSRSSATTNSAACSSRTSRCTASTVRMANTHLQHNDNLERQEQAAKIVELLGDDPKRTLLTGDLNAVPETPEITTLTEVFTDTWAKVGEGDGFTYSGRGSGEPDRLRALVRRHRGRAGRGAHHRRVRPPAGRRGRRRPPLTHERRARQESARATTARALPSSEPLSWHRVRTTAQDGTALRRRSRASSIAGGW